MKLTLLLYELYLPGSHSLKDKRRVIKSLKERLRSRFNVSIAEVDYIEKWQRSTVAIALVTSDGMKLDGILNTIDNHIYERYDVQVIKFERIDY